MENTSNDNKNWLQELTNQSWNLELLISGAAIFSTSFLPDLTEQAINYYYENYLSSNDFIDESIPTLAFSFAKAATYLLIITFVIHFILRAFWVGLVGLRAVFPQGINYENIPKANNELIEIYKEKFGSLDDYIIRLDKFCSKIFSVAFMLVMFSFMMASMYLFIFAIIFGAKNINQELYYKYRSVLGIGLFVFFMLFSVFFTLIGQKKYRENPKYSQLYKKLVISSTWMYFGMFKPINYITFVFASNLPRKSYYKFATLFGASFFLIAMVIYLKKAFENKEVTFLESRSFYSSGSRDFKLNANFYDNQRTENDDIPEASIQSDIIEEPFIKLFINYNKALDEDLGKICKAPLLDKKLSNKEKRFLRDKANIECLKEYFQVSLNDSTLQKNDFLYESKGGSFNKGISTYLSTENCKIGRNTLSIKALAIDSLPKKVWTKYVTIPFWYAKD